MQLNELSTTNAIGTPSTEVITAANCQEVAKAMLAVEMTLAARMLLWTYSQS